MAVERERLEATATLLYSKIQVAKEFAETKQIYKDMISSQEIGEYNTNLVNIKIPTWGYLFTKNEPPPYFAPNYYTPR